MMRNLCWCVWAVSALSGCGDDDGGGGGARPALVVTTSDFSMGGLGVIDEDGQVTVAEGPTDDQDTVPARLGDRVVLLERGEGRVKVQSADDPLVTERVIELDPMGTTPYAANPQAVVGTSSSRAYVSLLARSTLVVIDPTADGAAGRIAEIDLAPLAGAMDMDPNVDASSLVKAGDRVFVALGRYSFDAMYAIHFDAGSVLGVIDAATDAVVDVDDATDGVQGVDLFGENPTQLWHDAAGNRLLVLSHGDFFVLDGGIEAVSLDTLESTGLILDESMVGAEINGFAVVDAGHGWVIAGEEVRPWDIAAGTLGDALEMPAASALELDGETLWVSSRAMEGAGIYAYRASDGVALQPYSAPMTIGTLPPYGMASVP
jgi:hypothetical protein